MKGADIINSLDMEGEEMETSKRMPTFLVWEQNVDNDASR